MTVCYFGFLPSSGKSRISASLKEKGIEMLRAPPSMLYINTVAFTIFPLYAAFISLLSCIASAVSRNQSTSFYQETFKLQKPNDPFPIPLPPLCLRSYQGMDDDFIAYLNDEGFDELSKDGNDYFIHRTPSRAILERVFLDYQGNDVHWVPFNAVHLQAMQTLLKVINIITLCSKTLTFVSHERIDGFASTRKSYVTDSLKDSKRMRVDTGTSASTSYDSERQVSGLDEKFTSIASLSSGIPSESAFIDPAKFGVAASHYTSTTTLMHSDVGVCFQFVEDLASPDLHAVPSFIQKYFLLTLGNSREDCFKYMSRIRGDFGQIKTTYAGHVLAHIVTCLEIAINGQARPFITFNGSFYEGTFVQGDGFQVYYNDQRILPQSKATITRDIGVMSSHHHALEEIEKIAPGTTRYTIDGVDHIVQDMFTLRSGLLDAALTFEEQRKVASYASLLRFPLNSWGMNPGNFVRCLSLISGDQEFDETCPISHKAIFSTDKVRIALSCFGFNVPSVVISGGTPIELGKKNPPRSMGQARKKKDRQAGDFDNNSAQWTMSVRFVDLDTGVNDMKKVLAEGRYWSVGRKANKDREYFTLSGRGFEQVYLELSKVANVETRIAEEGNLGGKAGLDRQNKGKGVDGGKRKRDTGDI